MFILRKKLPKFSKIIKLQFQLGFSKLTPKLNLTLAPLGLNLVNLANEFNNYKYTLVDENYFVNCRLQINNKTNIYNIKIINIDFSFLTQLIIKNCADNELIKKKLFLSWIIQLQTNAKKYNIKNLSNNTIVKPTNLIILKNNIYFIDNNSFYFYSPKELINIFSQIVNKN